MGRRSRGTGRKIASAGASGGGLAAAAPVLIRAEAAACPECGPAAVNHRLEWSANAIQVLTRPLFLPLDFIWSKIGPAATRLILSPIVYPISRALVGLGLARLQKNPEPHDSWRTRCLWEEAGRRGIEMEEVRLDKWNKEIFFADFRGRRAAFDGLPRPAGATAGSLAWMDDKELMREKFAAAGIPVAKGGAAFLERTALRIFNSIDKPAIVKPNLGSRSRHTTIHISNAGSLIAAFRSAKKLSPWAVIEEELSGLVHRVTLINGKVAGIIRRDPPFVSGDGRRTIRELAKAENALPARHGPIFHEIPLGEDAEAELKLQNLSWNSVPERGRRVVLGQKVGRGNGATNADVTADAHPENVLLFERIARVLGDPLVGVDFIIEDMARPWRAQPKCGAIECNSLPFIDLHHYPYSGKIQNAAGAVWEMIFPGSGR